MNAQSDQREWLESKADTLTESEVAEVLEYIALMQAMNHQTTEPELFYRALAGTFFSARRKNRGRALQH